MNSVVGHLGVKTVHTLWVFLVALSAGLAVPAAADDANFSQFPGFTEYFSKNPPRDVLPGAEERELLIRHRPRFFLPDGHEGPISFYGDYVAQGVLRTLDGAVISDAVTPELLNRMRDDPQVEFEHVPDAAVVPRPVVFARIDRDEIDLGDGTPKPLTFLTYHAVFRHSGLAAGLLGWQIILAGSFGDLDDWHQLDHYTAASLVLDESGTPIALLVQQHNNQRTYLLGEGYTLPNDGRPALDVAIRSNELYPHASGRRNHKAVRFPGANEMKYLLGLTGRPFISADDITDPVREASYELRFLPPADAFYTFKGFLGVRRMLPGRSGPPGADYNTLPELKPWRRQLLAGYWRPGNTGDASRLLHALRDPQWVLNLIRRQAAVFGANLACARRWGADCAFE